MNGRRRAARAVAPPLGEPRPPRIPGLDFTVHTDGRSVARWFDQAELDAGGPAHPIESACEVIPEWRHLAGTDMDPAVRARQQETARG